jgi:16S rRNA (guanine527-N7)-methyltransferase
MSAAAPPDAAPALMTAAEFARRSRATPGQMADLERFLELLTAGNAVMNLVGPASLPDFWSRHAWDSAQLLRIAPDALVWADPGAGAGFPESCWRSWQGRAASTSPVGSMAKRCRFLPKWSCPRPAGHGPQPACGKPRPACGDRHRARLARRSPPARYARPT